MSTRSTISVELPDGSILSSYCHNDGYLSNNGKILKHNYTTLEQALELVQGGEMSSLGETTEKTVYYMRDRGETNAHARKLSSLLEYNLKVNKQEYNYIFKDGAWHYFKDNIKSISIL